MRPLALLFALALVACDGEPSIDAGSPSDAGPGTADAGEVPTSDAGLDAGAPDPDGGGGDPDAGAPVAAIDMLVTRLSDPGATTEALDALMYEVAFGPGWPVHEGPRWLFATRWDGAPSGVALVGDVNGWEPSANPASAAADGAHYWVVIDEADFAVPAAGAGYKWFGAPDVYRAPPESTAYDFDEFGEIGLVAPPTDRRWRERFGAFQSTYLEAPRALRALLPVGFERGSASAASARVLLMHDGQNVFHPDAFFGGWQVDAAVSDPAFADVVVLAVDNAPDRFDAYTHVADDVGGGPTGGRADDYAQLLFDEALPFFRDRYGLSRDAEDLAVGGSSLGGLVTLHLALSRPAEFACAIAMSSTLGWGAFDGIGTDALVQRWAARGPVAIYLDSGGGGTCADLDGDGVFEDSDDRDNYCTTNQLRDHLAGLGYTFDVDLFHWHEAGAPHNEAAWALRMPRALQSCAAAGW